MIESQNRQNKVTSPQKIKEDASQEINLRPDSFSAIAAPILVAPPVIIILRASIFYLFFSNSSSMHS